MKRTAIVLAGLALFAVGCKKKPKDKPTGPTTEVTSGGPAPGAQADAAPAAPPSASDAAAAAPSGGDAAAPTGAAPEGAKPSNPGGPGPALELAGDAKAGGTLFGERCKKCHGEAGKGGVKNEGSTDGTVPGLAPIDRTIWNKDAKLFAKNVDLFLEHGSTPEGKADLSMPSFGDEKKLTPQQIADVIAYVETLNP